MGAGLGEHRVEHRLRQPAGVGVVAGAVVAVEHRAAADLVLGAVGEGMARRRAPSASSVDSWAMRPEHHDGLQAAASPASVAARNGRQAAISAVAGLFSGGTQRTALAMRASIRARPSSGRAS